MEEILKEHGYILDQKYSFGTGNVYSAWNLKKNCQYVIKIFEKSEYSQALYRNEVTAYKLLRKTHVTPKFIEAFEFYLSDEWYGILVIEKLNYSLFEFISQSFKSDIDEMALYKDLEQEMLAKIYPKLEILEQHGIICGDINTGNIIFKILPNGQREAYIIDFEYSIITDLKTGYNLEGTTNTLINNFDERFDLSADGMYDYLIHNLRCNFGLSEPYNSEDNDFEEDEQSENNDFEEDEQSE